MQTKETLNGKVMDFPSILTHVLNNDEKYHWRYMGIQEQDIPDLTEVNSCKNFIKKYFGLAGKSAYGLLKKTDSITDERIVHIVSTYLLGLYLYEESNVVKNEIQNELNKYKKSLTNHQGTEFQFVWFLICLTHDLGYAYELKEIKKEYGNLAKISKLDQLDGVPRLYNNVLTKYYDYRKRRFSCLDHGLLSGHMMFTDVCKILEKHQEHRENEIVWRPELRKVYNMVAWIVSCHNIFFANTDDVGSLCWYSVLGMTSLIKDKATKPIKFNKYPLFFLFHLIDNLEPVKELKGFMECSGIQLSVSSCNIQINVNNSGKYSGMCKRLDGINDWLVNIIKKETEKYFTYTIKLK